MEVKKEVERENTQRSDLGSGFLLTVRKNSSEEIIMEPKN